jgi:hypothetical protein
MLRSKMIRPRLLLPICTALASSGCFSMLPIDGPAAAGKGDGALGSVTLHSERLGQSTLAPDSCRAGDREFYLGADFVDAKSKLITRLAFDPLEGPGIRIFESGVAERSIVFRRGDCKVLDYTFEPTNWRINDVYDYHVSVKFDCAGSGDAANGELSAAHCH